VPTNVGDPTAGDNRAVFGETIDVKIMDIGILDRILKPTQERIDAMANALGERGQLTPILITKDEVPWRIVAGATRLLAAYDLGWPTIRATVVSGSEQELLLIEIDENLQRHNLSDDELALLKAKRKELRGERLEAFQTAIEEAPATPATAKGGRGKKGGVRAAARKAGVSQTTARRHAPKVNQTKNGSVSEESKAAKPVAKSTNPSTPVEIATRLLVELVAHGLKADPVETAQTLRGKLSPSPASFAPIGKLAEWLNHVAVELFNDANHENQQRFLDRIGIGRLLGGMSEHMRDLLRERVSQDQNLKAKASKAAAKNQAKPPAASAPESTSPVAPDKTVH
jgi:ParB-like chromosome segregation protein Spo0J